MSQAQADLLNAYKKLALEGNTTLAANWLCDVQRTLRSGWSMVLIQPTVLRDKTLSPQTVDFKAPIQSLGTLAEKVNGPFYAGDNILNDPHLMETTPDGVPIYPVCLSRDFAKFGPGPGNHPAAPFAFLNEMEKPFQDFPRVMRCFIRYADRLQHPHQTPGLVVGIDGRWLVQGTVPFNGPQPVSEVTGGGEVTSPDDGTGFDGGGAGPPPAPPTPPGQPPTVPPDGNPPRDVIDTGESFPGVDVAYTPLSTHNVLGATGLRLSVADPSFMVENRLADFANPGADLIREFDTFPWSPVILRGWGSPSGIDPITGTGGFVFAGSDLNELEVYSGASIQTPYVVFRPEIIAAWGTPTQQGTVIDGYTASLDGTTLEFQAVNSSGAASVTPRITDNGDRLPRVNTSTSAPTVNDDSDDGYQPGDGWARTSDTTYYICEDATPGAAVWVQLTPDTGDIVTSTSATSTTVGTGSKTFTTAVALDVGIGTYIRVQRAAAATTYMLGPVTAITGTSITINVVLTGGSGTHTDWVLWLSGTSTTGEFTVPSTLRSGAHTPVADNTYNLGAGGAGWTQLNLSVRPAWADAGYEPGNIVKVNATVTGDEYYTCIAAVTGGGGLGEPRAGTDRDTYWRRLEKQNRTVDLDLVNTDDIDISTEDYASGTQFAITLEDGTATINLPSVAGTDGQYGDHFNLKVITIGGGQIAVKDAAGATLLTFNADGEAAGVKWSETHDWYIETGYAIP